MHRKQIAERKLDRKSDGARYGLGCPWHGHTLATCLALHTLVIWVIFEEFLRNVKTGGTMVSYPFALLEMFMLLVLVAKVDNKLRAKH